MDKSTTPPYVIKTSGNSRIKPQHINIDGSDDPYYRYKMRQLYVQVVGKGKMIKTVLLNIDDVARDLKVAPSYMVNYLGYEIGASCKYDPKQPERERASISGDLEAKDLSVKIKKFIKELILCPNCKLPEVTMSVEKKSICTSCRGCGHQSTLVNLKPKLQQYILNHPVQLISKEEKVVKKKQDDVMKEGSVGETLEEQLDTKPEKPKPRKTKKDDENDDDDGVEWSCPTSHEAVKQRRRDRQPDSVNAILSPDSKVKSDPLSELKSFIQNNPQGNIAQEVIRIQKEYGFPNSKRAHLLFDVLFQPDEVPDVALHKQTFLELVTDQHTQMGVLQCLEKHCEGALAKKSPIIVKSFYDHDIIDEETILDWNENRLQSPEIKNELTPLIKWLSEAEEESEEE